MRYAAKKLRSHGYSYVDSLVNLVDHKRMSRCYFSLGSSSISWMSRKKKLVALSTTKAKYIVLSMACYEAVSLRKLFSELF